MSIGPDRTEFRFKLTVIVRKRSVRTASAHTSAYKAPRGSTAEREAERNLPVTSTPIPHGQIFGLIYVCRVQSTFVLHHSHLVYFASHTKTRLMVYLAFLDEKTGRH